MGMVKKSITITEQQDAWVRAKVESGSFGNESEFFRSLIRRDQAEAERRVEELKAIVREGIEGGVSKRSIHDIWAAVEKKLGDDGQL